MINTDMLKKIDKKYLIGGGVAIIALILLAGIALKQGTTSKSVPLTKLTGEIISISEDKSSITVKTDTLTYKANMAEVKTVKNSVGEEFSINDIKAGDKIELRTRTDLKGGKVTEIDAYSLKNLSALGSDTDTAPDTADSKK